MDTETVQALAPVMGMMVGAFVVSIPLIAWGVRYAAKPLVEAIAKYRELQADSRQSDQVVLMHDRRLSLIEAELQHLQSGVQQLVEAEEFRRRLEAPAAGREIAAATRAPLE